jgi:hypothetical protein
MMNKDEVTKTVIATLERDEPLPKERLEEKLAEADGIWKFASLGRARVYACGYKDYFNFTIKQLQQKKWLTAIGPACETPDKY